MKFAINFLFKFVRYKLITEVFSPLLLIGLYAMDKTYLFTVFTTNIYLQNSIR